MKSYSGRALLISIRSIALLRLSAPSCDGAAWPKRPLLRQRVDVVAGEEEYGAPGEHTVEDAERHVMDVVERRIHQPHALIVARRHHQEVAAGEKVVEAVADADVDDQRQMQCI